MGGGANNRVRTKLQNTPTAAFGFRMRYAKHFINENISRLNHDDKVSSLHNSTGAPWIEGPSESIISTQAEWSVHDRA